MKRYDYNKRRVGEVTGGIHRLKEEDIIIGELSKEFQARMATQAFAMLKEYSKHPQRKGGDKMDIKLVTKDDKVIAIQNEGVTIVRLGADDALIEQTIDTAIIETTAKSKGKVVGTDRFTVALDIPEVREDQLELLELAAAQAKVRCKNAVRAPGGGLSSVQKGILSALKEANPEAFAALLKSAEEDAEVDEESLEAGAED